MSDSNDDCYKTQTDGKRSIVVASGKDGIDVIPQSTTAPLFQTFFQTYEKEDITLTEDMPAGTKILNVSPGHGITVGDYLILYTPYYAHQSLVLAVSVNHITLEVTAPLIFPQAITTIIRGKIELNVNGSVTPVEFKVSVPGESIPPIDISAAIFSMIHSAAGDNSKFGDLAKLANGIELRKDSTAINFSLGVYKDNREFKLVNGTVDYTDKAGGGKFGTDIKIIFNGLGNYEQVIRMNPDLNDIIVISVNDDLRALDSFQIALIGSYTEGE